MAAVKTVHGAQAQMNSAAQTGGIQGIVLPPRPLVVQQIQEEMARPEQDMRRIAYIVGQDVGLTVAVLKTVNSPLYGLSRKAESVEEALNLIGLRQLESLVTSVAMRNLLKGDSNFLGRFYDTSARRALAMTRMAKATGVVDIALAQTFGLFCDVGIPLLMQRFSNYKQTLGVANQDGRRSFTEVEHEAHNTDHALIGALMVRSWGLANSVALAIRMHHDYHVFLDPQAPLEVVRLISLNIVAEEAIQRYARIHSNVEWQKGGDYVPSTLAMEPAEVEEWIEELTDGFEMGLD